MLATKTIYKFTKLTHFAPKIYFSNINDTVYEKKIGIKKESDKDSNIESYSTNKAQENEHWINLNQFMDLQKFYKQENKNQDENLKDEGLTEQSHL